MQLQVSGRQTAPVVAGVLAQVVVVVRPEEVVHMVAGSPLAVKDGVASLASLWLDAHRGTYPRICSTTRFENALTRW